MNMKSFVFFLLLLASGPLQAQQKGNMTSKSEMQEQVNELKKEIADLEKELADARKNSPGDVAEIESEIRNMKMALGMAQQALGNMSGVSDQQIAASVANENRLVPVKDSERIASIASMPANKAAMQAQLSRCNNRIEQKLKPDILQSAQALYKSLLSAKASSRTIATIASSLWIQGAPEGALYLLDKVCQSNPENPEYLNNFGAFLTMTGAEELAIPLLQRLNRQFPRNSIILNNLGQAWFGLGDQPQATKFLDSCVRIYAMHPQANYTICLLELSKGNKSAAKAALEKSLQSSYSEEKLNLYKKLGGKPDPTRIPWYGHRPQDALGLDHFVSPPYCLKAEDGQAIHAQWEKFDADLLAAIDKLQARLPALEAKTEQAASARISGGIGQVSQGRSPYGALMPAFFRKANLELSFLGDKFSHDLQPLMEELGRIGLEVEKMRKQMQDALDKDPDMPCESRNAILNKFLSKANPMWQHYNESYIDFWRRYINEAVYYTQYISSDEASFEQAKIKFQIRFLQKLREQRHEEEMGCRESEGKPGYHGLADFDVINCKDHSTLNILGTTIETKCNVMTTKISYAGVSVS